MKDKRFLVNLSPEFREIVDELVQMHYDETGIKTSPRLLVESLVMNIYNKKEEMKSNEIKNLENVAFTQKIENILFLETDEKTTAEDRIRLHVEDVYQLGWEYHLGDLTDLYISIINETVLIERENFLGDFTEELSFPLSDLNEFQFELLKENFLKL